MNIRLCFLALLILIPHLGHADGSPGDGLEMNHRTTDLNNQPVTEFIANGCYKVDISLSIKPQAAGNFYTNINMVVSTRTRGITFSTTGCDGRTKSLITDNVWDVVGNVTSHKSYYIKVTRRLPAGNIYGAANVYADSWPAKSRYIRSEGLVLYAQ